MSHTFFLINHFTTIVPLAGNAALLTISNYAICIDSFEVCTSYGRTFSDYYIQRRWNLIANSQSNPVLNEKAYVCAANFWIPIYSWSLAFTSSRLIWSSDLALVYNNASANSFIYFRISITNNIYVLFTCNIRLIFSCLFRIRRNPNRKEREKKQSTAKAIDSAAFWRRISLSLLKLWGKLPKYRQSR